MHLFDAIMPLQMRKLCRYSLTEDGDQYNAFQFATMEKINGDWQFHADGIGMNGSIKELETCIQY